MSAIQPQYPQHVKGVEYFSLGDALRHFKQTVEKETGQPIYLLEVNACEFLDDIMKWIGLGENKRKEVLGRNATTYLVTIESERVSIPAKH